MISRVISVGRRAAAVGVTAGALGLFSVAVSGAAHAGVTTCTLNLSNNGGVSAVELNACKVGVNDIQKCESILKAPPASRPADIASAACIAANNPGTN